VRAAAREQVNPSAPASSIPPNARLPDGEAVVAYARGGGCLLSCEGAAPGQLTLHLAEAIAVITTAQVPGRPAPLLITTEMLGPPCGPVCCGGWICGVSGGNCAGSQPDCTLGDRRRLRIIGASTCPPTVPHHASCLYSRNLGRLLENPAPDDGLTLTRGSLADSLA